MLDYLDTLILNTKIKEQHVAPETGHPRLLGYGELEQGKELCSFEEVAKFIVKNGAHGDVMITDCLDTPFITTMGTFIDEARDKEYLKKLLPILTPMQ